MSASDNDKLRCVERELKYRYRVYPRRVENGQMTQKQADYEIRVMEDIAADYRAAVEADPGPLFKVTS